MQYSLLSASHASLRTGFKFQDEIRISQLQRLFTGQGRAVAYILKKNMSFLRHLSPNAYIFYLLLCTVSLFYLPPKNFKIYSKLVLKFVKRKFNLRIEDFFLLKYIFDGMPF